ncbi:hypothetical protein R1sor_012031 [Riccia sorocarpa]|uniref:Uncharacterized protein n=1 Tax=Riccia sorocarpa TaxID=122646 RepID=A0ABD3I6G4_9MARC
MCVRPNLWDADGAKLETGSVVRKIVYTIISSMKQHNGTFEISLCSLLGTVCSYGDSERSCCAGRSCVVSSLLGQQKSESTTARNAGREDPFNSDPEGPELLSEDVRGKVAEAKQDLLWRRLTEEFCTWMRNPEEGELSPQLLDRFGMHAQVITVRIESQNCGARKHTRKVRKSCGNRSLMPNHA